MFKKNIFITMALSFTLMTIILVLNSLDINETIKNNKNTNNQIILNNSNNSTYGITKESYTNKSVKITYPQITNLKDIKKQNKINKIIKNEALKIQNFYGDTDGLTLDITYNKWKSDNLLSIQYSGIGYVKGAAYPNNLFYTTNININKGNRIRLKDLVNIDESIIIKFKSGKFKALKDEHDTIVNDFTNNELIEIFNKADSLDNDSATFSYLTKNSLGISLSVAHVLGDHAEFEIKYEEIKNNLKLKNKI